MERKNVLDWSGKRGGKGGVAFEKVKPDVREKALEHGFSFLFDEELVMLILGSGTRQIPVELMAERITGVLNDFDSDEVVENLMHLKGVGQGKALAVGAALELGRRRNCHLRAPIKSPCDIVPFVKNYAVCEKEHFLLVTLNGGNEIIQIHVITVGTLNRTLIHPREVFSVAMRDNAAAIIVSHNHPSGNCTPSDEDIKVTEILEKVSVIMGIELLDHVIVSRETYFSFLENKMLKKDQKKERDLSEEKRKTGKVRGKAGFDEERELPGGELPDSELPECELPESELPDSECELPEWDEYYAAAGLRKFL